MVSSTPLEKELRARLATDLLFISKRALQEFISNKPVMTIDSGETHTAIIDKDGDCYVWGSVTNKKLGLSQTSADGIFTKPMRLTTLNKERKALKEREIAEKAALKKKKKKRKKSEYVPVGLANYEGVA